MFEKSDKVKVFAQNDKPVEKKPMEKKPMEKKVKCPFHESHDRHCVDCNKKV